MVKVGLDAYTIREISRDPFIQLDYAKAHGFDGLQFDEAEFLGSDAGKLREIAQHASVLGLYSMVSVDIINPAYHSITVEENARLISNEIKLFADAGWHELRCRTGDVDERSETGRAGALAVMELLRPVLRDYTSRLNFENHGDCTTFELVSMIERIGSDVMGINLDTGNAVVNGEEPYLATLRAAPYVHSTHAKDCILYSSDKGVTRQLVPAGDGIVRWRELLPLLLKRQPALTLSIEDHKGLYEIELDDPVWRTDHPDMDALEESLLRACALSGDRIIASGKFGDPEEYDALPYARELVSRTEAARDFLKKTLTEIVTE